MGKKKVHIPRRKRMNRNNRLQHVKDINWLENYEGKSIVKGYCKWFGVDELCALQEIDLLGYKVSGKEKQNAIKAMETRKMQNLKRKEKREVDQKQYKDLYSDETFYFIAGYTENGVSYGTTRMEEQTDTEIKYSNSDERSL